MCVCACAWQLQECSCGNPRCPPEDCFSVCIRLDCIKCDARRHSAASATGKWSPGIWCVSLLCFGFFSTAVQTHILGFCRRPQRCVTCPLQGPCLTVLLPSTVQKCVQTHKSTGQERVTSDRWSRSKRVLRAPTAVSSVTCDTSHLVKRFYLINILN